tara:strand:- start:1002 stop:1769 length:768 start_codon:yes stop_codon:yes gene_type:complete
MKNTFWISTAPRTGSMWLFNVVREIFIINKYNVFPSKIPKNDKDFLEIYNSKSINDNNNFNKYVFKVHSPMNSDLLNSKVLTTIRDPRDVCASFREFMKSDFESALTAAKGMIDFVKYYKSFEEDYLNFFKYEDIENNSVETIIAISKFIECEINLEVAKLISEKFNKSNIRELIKSNDDKLKNKIKNKEKVEKSEVVFFSKENYRAFDINTGFQTNHISKRNSGEWQKAFSEEEIEIINSDIELKNFLKEYNYN